MRYGVTNDTKTTLAANLGTSDAIASMIGPLAGAIVGRRYNCAIDAEIIGCTDCHTSVFTILERGVSATTVTTHALGAQVLNLLDRDYLEHAAGGGGVGGKLYLAKHYT